LSDDTVVTSLKQDSDNDVVNTILHKISCTMS
jgi:hypothetical protein